MKNKSKHNFTSLRKLSLETFIKEVTETAEKKAKEKSLRLNKEVLPKLSTRKLHWIHFIKTNHLTCPVTGKKVSYCSYDREDHKNTPPSFHYNFYAEDGTLFTVDHKIPVSKGGSKTKTTNVQPMVAENNFEKGAELIYC